MVAIADAAYLEGPIYAAVSANVPFVAAVALLMIGVLAVGFIRRDQRDLANIGLESYLVALAYVLGVGVVLLNAVGPVPMPW
jgi:hypothetical protein